LFAFHPPGLANEPCLPAASSATAAGVSLSGTFGFSDLLFPGEVIDSLPAKEFRSGHINAKYKALGGNDDECVEQDLIRSGSGRRLSLRRIECRHNFFTS
jgi:hypothetical protein